MHVPVVDTYPFILPHFPETPRAAGLGHPALANEIPVRQGCLNVLPSNGSEGVGCMCVCKEGGALKHEEAVVSAAGWIWQRHAAMPPANYRARWQSTEAVA